MVRQVAVATAVALAGGVLLAGGAAQGAGKSAPSNTSPPAISGTDRAGETLSASSGSWTGSTPMSFSYHWQRCDQNGNGCGSIGGAKNQTYLAQKGDTGHRLRVSVTASNSDGSSNAVSAPTNVIAQGLAPANTSPPTISGTAKAGNVLTAANGSWNNNPTSFSYQWRRCDAGGNNCNDVGPDKSTYQLDSGDVGSTIRVEVKAKNDYGSSTATSAQTAVVAAGGPVPANTAPPVISGLPRNGQLLATSAGNWSNTPTSFHYQWLRCNTVGNNCVHFGTDGQSQRLAASEVGHTIRVAVSAKNQYGTTTATSVPTAVVSAATSTPGSIPVTQVSLPNQLIISSVQFVPSRLTSRSAFLARFRISDSHGHFVSGALVYSIGLPYSWVRNASEVVTGSDGWATITFVPTTHMPLHHAALVMFVRARKPGESLLGGVSTRRLVQVSIG